MIPIDPFTASFFAAHAINVALVSQLSLMHWATVGNVIALRRMGVMI